MYDTYYDVLHPFFGQKNLQFHYIDTDGKILSMKAENIMKDIKNLEDIFDFSDLDMNQEVYSNKNEKVVGKFKNESPEKLVRRICLFKIKGLFV